MVMIGVDFVCKIKFWNRNSAFANRFLSIRGKRPNRPGFKRICQTAEIRNLHKYPVDFLQNYIQCFFEITGNLNFEANQLSNLSNTKGSE